MNALLELIARHKAGARVGIASVCSAHPLVIEAAFAHALRHDLPLVLIEATSNQVNQEGGYTGMTPAGFRDFVWAIADRAGFPRAGVVLGGDHLGPNVWTALPADEAMARSEALIDGYVRAGFRKIHLDCSMACADDPAPLPEATIAERAAWLAAVAEAAWREAGGEPPVYVIGTEVPVPGGETEAIATLALTDPAAARATIAMHRRLFAEAGLEAAWRRVIALVVQPGVEFDHHRVIDFVPDAARGLAAMIEREPGLVFEAHSTDYQTRAALTALVAAHFAVLKVGPGLTFALREALWALDAIAAEWLGEAAPRLRETVLQQMRANPAHWARYYHGHGQALAIDLQYSLSDRVRYYWPDPAIAAAQRALFAALEATPPPAPLVWQYLPRAAAALRARGEAPGPRALVLAHIATVLEDYHAACHA